MEATDAEPTSFHIHTLATGPEGRLCLLPPERVDIAAEHAEAVTNLPPTNAGGNWDAQ
jgi:hypothetical protein